MTYLFNYTIANNVLNTNTAGPTWEPDPNPPLGDSPIGQLAWINIINGTNGAITFTTPFVGARYRVSVKLSIAFQKQNSTDASDTVLSTICDNYTPTILYASSTTPVEQNTTQTAICEREFLLVSSVNPVTLPISIKLLSGPAGLGYTLLAYSNATTPYTRLQIGVSY